MRSESQWVHIGKCIHCNSPIYEMNNRLRFTGKNCRCELPIREEELKKAARES